VGGWLGSSLSFFVNFFRRVAISRHSSSKSVSYHQSINRQSKSINMIGTVEIIAPKQGT
jgi:hypothetical protein